MPIHHKMKKPQLLKQTLHLLQFGVHIGMTSDVKGIFILTGDSTLFSLIGKSMFGIPVEGDMFYRLVANLKIWLLEVFLPIC